jgi:hypothetical protein
MAMAFWTSRIVYVAAKLRLDQLSKGPKSAKEFAGKTGTPRDLKPRAPKIGRGTSIRIIFDG